MVRGSIARSAWIDTDPRLEDARRAFEEARLALEDARENLLRTHVEVTRLWSRAA
ncbi:hypothetical protein [Microbacterium sp.]|uniref:hypothetical protein n=1 Tax=Microbacterium sp. TaxID=51671 RepID=UPI003C74FB44